MRWWFFCFLCRQDHWDGFCHFLDIRKKHTLLSYYTHYYWLLIYRQSVSSTNYWGWCVSWSVLSRMLSSSGVPLPCTVPPLPVPRDHTQYAVDTLLLPTPDASPWLAQAGRRVTSCRRGGMTTPAGDPLLASCWWGDTTASPARRYFLPPTQAPHPASPWNTGHSEYIVISVRLAYCLQSRPIYPNVVRTLVSLPFNWKSAILALWTNFN